MEEKQLVNLVGAGNTESQEKIEKPTLSFTQDVWRRLKKINWRPYHFGFYFFLFSFFFIRTSLFFAVDFFFILIHFTSDCSICVPVVASILPD